MPEHHVTIARVVVVSVAFPNRIDILTRLKGWRGKLPGPGASGTYGSIPISVLSRQDLIACKRAVGRPRDLADAATLEEIERRDRR